MSVTKTYSIGSTNIFVRLYQLLSRIFNSIKPEIQHEDLYYNDDDLKLEEAKDMVRRQVEKYKNQTYLSIPFR